MGFVPLVIEPRRREVCRGRVADSAVAVSRITGDEEGDEEALSLYCERATNMLILPTIVNNNDSVVFFGYMVFYSFHWPGFTS